MLEIAAFSTKNSTITSSIT